MLPGVNFNNILRAAFQLKVFISAAFLYLQFVFVIFWQKDIGKRAARKILLKLTIQLESESSTKPTLIDELKLEINSIEFFNSTADFSMPFGHYNSTEEESINGGNKTDSTLSLEFRGSQFFAFSIDEDELLTKMDSQVNPEESGAKVCAERPSQFVDLETLNAIQADQTSTSEQSSSLIDDSIGHDQNMSSLFTPQCQDKNLSCDLNKAKDKNSIDIDDNLNDKPKENSFENMSNANDINIPQPDSGNDITCLNHGEIVVSCEMTVRTSFTDQDQSCTELNNQYDDNFESSIQKYVESNCIPGVNPTNLFFFVNAKIFRFLLLSLAVS